MEAKYYMAIVAAGIAIALMYGYLNDPTGITGKIFQNSTSNETAIISSTVPSPAKPLVPTAWWFWMAVGGVLVYMFKRGADYYVGASYEDVEIKIREFAENHKKMPNIQIMELKEVARGVWEGHIENMTDYRTCQYPINAPFKVRCVGGRIKEFTMKAVVDPREKQYVTHEELIDKQKSLRESLPFIGSSKPQPKQENIVVQKQQTGAQ